MDDKKVIVISDSEEEKEHEVDLPDWLPDGWTMEVYRAADGTKNLYYTSPISDYTFTSKSEVLKYLFSGEDERILQSMECAAEMTFQKAHEWLPKGWEMEIRAGGRHMDKMYKFYVEPCAGVRLLSKDDVLLYLKESKISKCDTSGECDTSSDDNILAKIEFNPTVLAGWIREVVFRKTKKGSIRRDAYYTDPASGYTFRTFKSASAYLENGETKHAIIQKTSVHELYSFDKCADLPECLRGRLRSNRQRASRPLPAGKSLQVDQDEDSNSSEDGDTSLGSDSSYEEEDESINSMKGKETKEQRFHKD